MARTQGEIYDRIAETMNDLNIVNGLDPNPDSWSQFVTDIRSGSKVATWRILVAAISYVISLHEGIMERIKKETDSKIRNQPYGQLPWYSRIAKAYRSGYSLQFIDNEYRYTDTAQQDTGVGAANIVKRASAVDRGGAIRVKVADVDNNGVPYPLTQSQKQGVKEYINNLHPAGVNFKVISLPPDKLELWMEVVYDPTVIDQNGKLINDPQKEPVRDAVNFYIRNLPFDAMFNLTDMMNEVEKAKGVIDPRLHRARAQADNTNQWQELFDVLNTPPQTQQDYEAVAGHLTIQALNVTYVAG
jgi:hypothetical protein